MDNNGIITKWMTYDEIMPYREQLIEMEYQLVKQYHYPDREIPVFYIESRVDMLEEYLKSGKTFFWGALINERLIGYYWAYISEFINTPRWNLRSLMIDPQYQHIGLGKLAIEEGLKKASEMGCYDAATEYVPSNVAAGRLYERMGYSVSRIEVVKKI